MRHWCFYTYIIAVIFLYWFIHDIDVSKFRNVYIERERKGDSVLSLFPSLSLLCSCSLPPGFIHVVTNRTPNQQQENMFIFFSQEDRAIQLVYILSFSICYVTWCSEYILCFYSKIQKEDTPHIGNKENSVYNIIHIYLI